MLEQGALVGSTATLATHSLRLPRRASFLLPRPLLRRATLLGKPCLDLPHAEETREQQSGFGPVPVGATCLVIQAHDKKECNRVTSSTATHVVQREPRFAA